MFRRKIKKKDRHLSLLESDSNEYIILKDKQSTEEIWIQRAVKTTTQRLYDRRLLDASANADEVLEDFLFVKRCRPNLEKKNDDFIQRFCS